MRRAKPSLLAGPSGKNRCLAVSVKICCERKEAAGRCVSSPQGRNARMISLARTSLAVRSIRPNSSKAVRSRRSSGPQLRSGLRCLLATVRSETAVLKSSHFSSFDRGLEYFQSIPDFLNLGPDQFASLNARAVNEFSNTFNSYGSEYS